MHLFITGCAGFIGSHFVDYALQQGWQVTGFDNLVTGQTRFLETANKNRNFRFIAGDLLDLDTLISAMRGASLVAHFAANADVRFGLCHPNKDLQQNTMATFHVLEAMRQQQVKTIIFASTGSVYGETTIIPTPEDCPFPIQTSLYGASKLAAEGLIQAYCEGFGMQAFIFRFVSILGQRYSHGHVFDFYKQLKNNPYQLTILGNGKQKKSYLHVNDCMQAIGIALEKSKGKINIFNLGTNEYCEVNDSARWLCEYLEMTPTFSYSGGDRGWIGDNPLILLDCDKINSLGWKPRYSIHDAIISTVEYLQTNPWLIEKK